MGVSGRPGTQCEDLKHCVASLTKGVVKFAQVVGVFPGPRFDDADGVDQGEAGVVCTFGLSSLTHQCRPPCAPSRCVRARAGDVMRATAVAERFVWAIESCVCLHVRSTPIVHGHNQPQ